MGNNSAYTAFEQTTVGVYDALKGKMSKAVLSAIMEPYRDCDIDSGGKEGLLSFDKLEAEEIVLKVWGVKVPKRPQLPDSYSDWTDAQQEENEKYQDAYYAAFHKITKKFGWS